MDRVQARVDDPYPLFKTLTEQLLLPEAWPVTTSPFFISGGVSLGNLYLEVLQASHQREPARLYGLCLELEPFEISLPALDERNIPSTPPMPFYVIDDQGWQVTAWTIVYLGGLLGSSRLARLFFNLVRRLPQETWERGTLPTSFNRQFGQPFVFDRVYPSGMPFAIAYNPAWQSAHLKREQPPGAGLELKRVYEITIGAKDYPSVYECWKSFLAPFPERSPGVWKLPDGLLIHLVEHEETGLLRMIWQVASLNRAAQFLHKRGMLGSEIEGMVTIAPDVIQNLDIRLVQ